MRTALLIALTALAAGGAWARSKPVDWGHLPTGGDIRRSQLIRDYCRAQAERSEMEIARGRWVNNPRCW